MLVFRDEGGIKIADKYAPIINLSQHHDFSRLNAHDQYHFKSISSVLERLPVQSSLVLASPRNSRNLISKLISEKPFQCEPGGHTLPTIFRRGTEVTIHKSLRTIDKEKLEKLLNLSFGRKLLTEYWDRMERDLDSVILAGDYLGAVVITNEKDIMYLDKFSVSPKSQGMGISDILWSNMRTNYPNMCWRSRKNNPINKW